MTRDEAARSQSSGSDWLAEPISENRSFTPHGFLLIQNCPIGRTGEMIYHRSEMPPELKFGSDNEFIAVSRSEQDLFAPETIASFNGAPITNDHPREEVTAGNADRYGVGSTHNPRRGTGQNIDMLVADLLITNRAAIDDVIRGKKEISLGYRSDYLKTGTGSAIQRNITGNHVALVKSGRCGARCAIGDSEPEPKEPTPMSKKTLIKTLLARFQNTKDAAEKAEIEKEMMDAVSEETEAEKKANDEAAEEKEKEKVEDSAVAVLGKRIGAMETQVADIATNVASFGKTFDSMIKLIKSQNVTDESNKEEEEKTETEGKAKDSGDGGDDDDESEAVTQDAATLLTHYGHTVADAEILSPGIELPKVDLKSSPKMIVDAICSLRRSALARALTADATAELIKSVTRGRTIDNIKSCGAIRHMFTASAMAVKAVNNDKGAARSIAKDIGQGNPYEDKTMTPAQANKHFAEFWAKNK